MLVCIYVSIYFFLVNHSDCATYHIHRHFNRVKKNSSHLIFSIILPYYSAKHVTIVKLYRIRPDNSSVRVLTRILRTIFAFIVH